MVVDFDGNAVGSDHRPSAETLLHTQLYKRFADIGCVLHTHSQAQTVATRLYAGAGHIHLEGYELLQAFTGNTTHAPTKITAIASGAVAACQMLSLSMMSHGNRL